MYWQATQNPTRIQEYDMKRYLIALALLAGASSVAQANCVGCSASGSTVFNGISLNGMQDNGVLLNGLQFNGFQLNGVQFNNWRLNGINLNGLTLNGWTLNGLQLNGLTLNGSTAQGFDTLRAKATDWSAVPLNQVQVRLPAAR
jgi:uncharacterized protein YjbI with pentapeptide repeats